ncbi:hypothetical protein HU200_057160 [Digitaria exilis]|uniref:F-box domain-containing protein n=1 Tax=Digitaria exilis TaxID=1010633 RepID=A0A835AHT2_9POAL|nr:hypothetical protein HU200_057160 [Digitaria exilis]
MARGGGEWELETAIELSAVASGLPGHLPSYFSGDGELQDVWINVTDVAVVTVSVSSLTSTSWGFTDPSWAFRLDLETLETELVDIDDGVSVKGKTMGDIQGIPDDVLELIFLLLASPAHLIRAAPTCKRWHGIVAGARFLSRFLSLNRRHLVAGSYYNGRQQEPPAFVASSSSSPPVVDGRRFSLDFLWSGDNVVVDPQSLRIVDTYGGLVLLSMEPYDPPNPICHVHMVVCEPLTRRYKVIPPMVTCSGYYHRSGPFLLDGDRAAGGIDLSNFRLMCVACHPDRRGSYRGSMFTASCDLDGSCSWHVYAIDDGQSLRSLMGRTRASVYWHGGGRAVTALDRSTAELSSSELPESAEEWDEQGTEVKVAVGRDGEPRILAIAPGCSVVRVFAAAMARGGGEWELEKRIELSAVASGLPGYLPSYFDDGEAVAWIDVTADAAAMVTVSVCSVTTSWGCMDSSWSFRLELESLEAELVDMDSGVLELDVAFPCELPWPPVLHART